MGPGNGSDSAMPPTFSNVPQDVEVPMSEAGTAERLFVNVDHDPGTEINNGLPATFFFMLCDGGTTTAPNAPLSDCGLACSIVGPDTTCSDLAGSQAFAVGELMGVYAFTDYFLANNANVKWSVTYDRGTADITP